MFSHKHQHTNSPPQEHKDPGVHPHQHGAVDPSLLATERGIWAVKWSLVGLAATAILQVVVVLFSGSAALLADTVHNLGDAVTAIPLWIAFTLARTQTFPPFHLWLRPDRRCGRCYYCIDHSP